MDIFIWIGFLALVFFLLFLDLGVFHKDSEVISTKEALKWTMIWIAGFQRAYIFYVRAQLAEYRYTFWRI